MKMEHVARIWSQILTADMLCIFFCLSYAVCYLGTKCTHLGLSRGDGVLECPSEAAPGGSFILSVSIRVSDPKTTTDGPQSTCFFRAGPQPQDVAEPCGKRCVTSVSLLVTCRAGVHRP